MKSEYTRTGARRAGDDYQDVVALELLVELLEHPTRYKWIRVEADDAGSLDDIVAVRSDGSFVVKQVKFSTDPQSETDVWTWEKLIQKKKGKIKQLPSLLEKWASSMDQLRKRGLIYEASVESNRRAAKDMQITLSANGLVDFDKIDDPEIRDIIVQQLGGEAAARSFFAEFHFYLDRSSLEDLEDSVRRRFYALGGKHHGWLNLKDVLRFWIRNRNQPPPAGAIILATVRSAALWYQLQSLPQQFEVPEDYILPSQDFHEAFMHDLLALQKGCIVLTASPGVGKSTYISYVFEQLVQQNIPIIRHHYFLSLSERSVKRLDHYRVAESLMSSIQNSFPEALGNLGNKNPNPAEFTTWIEACGRCFAQQRKAFIITIDGLDHVWRETGSIEELNRLLEHLLPTPEGVVILLGTQPLDDTQLPLRLVRSTPREQWRSLPLLDRGAVKQWLQHHEDELDLPEEQHAHDFQLDRLADALYEKSQGHPLHIRYSLKSLQEQNIPITKENIKHLPSCPHQNITEYYKELWISLGEEGREILHLFAACGFPWPSIGVTECLDPQGGRLAQINSALKQVKHLMVHDALGLRPFHISLLVFITGQPDHQIYLKKMKQCALNWLCTSAPDYWKWTYKWLLEADLGNDQPLINGPSRQWVVEAIAKRRPHQEASEILARSSWLALQHEDLPRCIEVGLLRDYFHGAYEFRSEILDTLLYSQLIIEEDPHLRATLHASLGNLSEAALVLLAENEAHRGNQLVVGKCFDTLNKRLKEVSIVPKGEFYEDWWSRLVPVLKVVALADDISPTKIVEFAIKIREYGWSYDALGIYSEFLRTSRRVRPLRQMLKMKMTALERSVVFRHTVLLALAEGLDLDHEVSVAESTGGPFAAIYAALRKVKNFKLGGIRFPSAELLALKEHEQYLYRRDVEGLFYRTFFCFLGNHLWHESKHNEEWLQKTGDHSWLQSFLYRLNAIAFDLAQLLLSDSPPSFGWFYEQLNGFQRPSWPEERDVHRYAICAERAIDHIALDVLILDTALGKTPEIVKDDLELAFTSGYCHRWVWMNVHVARRHKWLNRQALKWLLQEQGTQLASSIEQFSERASKHSTLASLAALYGLKSNARLCLREAASNLFSYGDHKDVLLYGALEVVQACHRANLPQARQWLLQLGPLIAKVGDFTDGDETGHLPRELADVLTEVAPDLLPAYYQWLFREEDYYDALSAFHSSLRIADLSAEINKALAKTAVDDESLAILVERSEKGDQGAQTALSSLVDLLGQRAVNRVKLKKSEDKSRGKYESYEESLPPPADFPPDHLIDYLSAAKARYFYRREECVKRWLLFWKNEGRGEEAFRTAEKEVNRGIELGNYDALFDLALSLYGKERAYPWLVKAHTERYGWSRYFTRKEEALRRWEMIKRHYPDRWFKFIQDTMKSTHGEPWHGLTVYERFVRLVEYCLFMGLTELARRVSEQVITSTLELVSPFNLPTPGWVNES